jgi:protein-tyrosine phosphatase
VYRAGVLSYFTQADHSVLNQLSVRAICDLRRAEERDREPTRWPDVAAAALSWDDGENMPTIRGFAAHQPRTPAGMHAAMIDLYRALPLWMGSRIRGLFDCIARSELPVVVHCAAGKDRTGIAIAVLLGWLGVPRQLIVEDYLLTNEAGNFEAFIQARRDSHLGLTDAHLPLLSMNAEVRKVLFAADAAYLDAALSHIDQTFGGVEPYLRDIVKLDATALARVRATLLD